MKKKWISILIIVVLLVVIRLLLPVFLENYANKSLDKIKGYNGVVEDVDLRLYRGAYIINRAHFTKTDGDFSTPFMAAEEVEISIDWDALFNHWQVVAHIVVENPELNFITKWDDKSSGKKISQTGSGVKWMQHFTKMSPLRFNALEVRGGSLSYKNLTTSPELTLFMDSIQIEAKNLQNVQGLDTALPGALMADALVMKSGNLNIEGGLNFKKEPMDFDANLTLEGVNMLKMNELLKKFANLDFDSGIFNLYAEVKMNSGTVEGYLKPVMDNVSVIGNEQEEPFFDKVWEVMAGAVTEVFENQKEDQLASRVPFSGTVNNVDADVSEALWNILKNAFVDAFEKYLKNKVEFQEEESNGG